MTAETLPAIRQEREIRVVHDALPVFDTGLWEHMTRIATAMAVTPLTPESLRGERSGRGSESVFAPYPREVAIANCIQVIEQAHRWGMSPFAVAQSTSVVRGRLMYEGKLVAAVIAAKVGVRLNYTYGRWNQKKLLVDPGVEAADETLGVIVHDGPLGRGDTRRVDGSVGAWKTDRNDSPWSRATNWRRQLAYRGAREWARIHEPGAMLGVLSDDEDLDDIVSRRTALAEQPGEGRPMLTSGFSPAPAPKTEIATVALSSDAEADEIPPSDPEKPKRHRRTRAQIEADNAALNAAQPETTAEPATDVSGGSAAPPRALSQSSPPSAGGALGDPVTARGFGVVELLDEGDKIDPETGEIIEKAKLEDEQSQGETRMLASPPSSDDSSDEAEEDFIFSAHVSQIGEAQAWTDVRDAMKDARASDLWSAATADDKQEIRKCAFVRAKTLRDSGADVPNPAADYLLFLLWLEFGLPRGENKFGLLECQQGWRSFFRNTYPDCSEAEKKVAMESYKKRERELGGATAE